MTNMSTCVSLDPISSTAALMLSFDVTSITSGMIDPPLSPSLSGEPWILALFSSVSMRRLVMYTLAPFAARVCAMTYIGSLCQ